VSERPQLLIIGAGFSGREIARLASEHANVWATRRDPAAVTALADLGVSGIVFDGSANAALEAALTTCTHLISTVGPNRSEPFHEPVLTALQTAIEHHAPRLQWLGYLSTVGVYGDHGGNWVTEETPCTTVQVRSRMRLAAEQAWLALAKARDLPMAILRLSGIYGPGRNALEDALAGRARRIIKPDQVFNRIHVSDLAMAAVQAMQHQANGIFNITDDCPAPSQDVVAYAHQLLDRSPPLEQDFATAELSEMARTFYSENKRVSNAKSKAEFAMNYRYPDYQKGLQSLLEEINSR